MYSWEKYKKNLRKMIKNYLYFKNAPSEFFSTQCGDAIGGGAWFSFFVGRVAITQQRTKSYSLGSDHCIVTPHSGLLTSRPGSETILWAFSKFKQCVKVSTTK